MDASFTTNQIFLFIGAAQGFILALVLLTMPRANRQANRILAAILVVFSFSISMHVLSHGRHLLYIPHHASVITFFFLLFGPLFYFYVNTLTLKSFTIENREYIHYLPFLICVIVAIPFYFESIQLESPHIVIELLAAFVVIHVLSYVILSMKLLWNHSNSIKDSFSSIEKINLRWLQFLIVGFTLTWIVALLFDSHPKLSGSWDYVWLLVSLFMYLIGYMGLRQPEIFSGILNGQLTEMKAPKKYEKSTLTNDNAEKYREKLLAYLASEKPFLKSDISLPEIAQNLSISHHHLSRVINERLKQNFFELMNSYRIEEAKRLLHEAKYLNYSIASIGFEAGFNSVSAFNTAFKKHVKITPSQFRDSNLQS